MSSSQQEALMGDGGGQSTASNPEDKHFDIVNESGDHNSTAASSIRVMTETLLDEESGRRPATRDEAIPQSSVEKNTDKETDTVNQDTTNKRKRTESPDSEIVVIDDNGERESIGSGLESDIEDNDSDAEESVRRNGVKEYDPCIDNNLPDTVTLLPGSGGSKLYLIGTAHFSLESQNDVSKIIQAVQPHIVVVELCKARVHILQLDEQTILEEAQKLSFENIRHTIQENGLFNGLMYILLLNMSARLTKELGMAPGGEFRRAFAEAKKVPNCLVHMGDRPINITIQRALSALSWWHTLKLGWHLLMTQEPISKEEVESCKRRDMLEEMLNEMTREFPALGEVFVKERDLYLTHSLQLACLPQRTPSSLMPVRVVGVVGIGHVSGILECWGKVKPSEIPPILRIPPPSLSSKVLCFTIKASFVGVIIFIGYKIIPIPSGETIQSLKSSVEGLWKIEVSIELVHIILSEFINITMEEAINRGDLYEHVQANFIYVVTNIPGPGVDLDDFESEYSRGCNCELECVENCSCSRFSPNYINNCILDNKLFGPVVECNESCKCSANCGNRLVQRGPLDCLVVTRTEPKGYRLETTKPIKKGQFICEYAGEVIGAEEALHRIESNKRDKSMNYVLAVSEHLIDRTIKTCIDPKFFGNIGRYCNHSCEPNSGLVPVRIEGIVPRICLFASRDIKQGEEITFNYAGEEASSIENLSDTPCLCGSSKCRLFLPHHPI